MSTDGGNGINPGGSWAASVEKRLHNLADGLSEENVAKGQIMAELGKIHSALVTGLGTLGARLVTIEAAVGVLNRDRDEVRGKLDSVPEDLEVTASRLIKLSKGEDAQKKLDAQAALWRQILGGVAIAVIVGVTMFVAGRLVH